MEDQLKNILAQCAADAAVMGKVFFPERFHRPFDPLHREMFELFDNSDAPKKALASPRGAGKTSMANLLIPARSILFHKHDYIVPVSASHTSAVQQSENLKHELVTNELIKSVWGDVTTNNFSKEQWVVNIAGREVCVMPRGAGQQIRGLLFRNSRPSLIVVDDLEDPEQVMNEARRERLKEWFFADLLNAVDRGADNWEILFIGTVLHENSLLEELLGSRGWESKRLEICDDNFNSNAPHLMTGEEIKELAEEYRREGEIDVFYREYRNMPISTQDAAFKKEYFEYYSEQEVNLNVAPSIDNFIIVDPAKTTKMESAESAIVGVAVDIDKNIIYVRDIESGHFHPDQLYNKIFEMSERINASVVGIEVTGLHEFVTYPLKNEVLRRNSLLQVEELHARGGRTEKGKTERVRSLVSFYRQGLVKHNPKVVGGLESQLLSFPRSKRWDIMDALGYVPEMLEKGERYMRPTISDEIESEDVIEREFRDLEEVDDYYEPPLDNFRVI